MKIESVEGQVGRASIPSGEYAVRLDFLDKVKAGDYVLVHSGFAIEVLDEAEALKTLEVFKELKEYEELGGEIPGRDSSTGAAQQNQ